MNLKKGDFIGVMYEDKERRLLYSNNAVREVFMIGQAIHYKGKEKVQSRE
ncbi:hypothetical protein [Parageobacillus thermantarcticus]|nr:hypothetical protein [Parageobacillus thermantarcticus]